MGASAVRVLGQGRGALLTDDQLGATRTAHPVSACSPLCPAHPARPWPTPMLICALPGHDPFRRADNCYEVAEERDELEPASSYLIIRFSCGAVEGRSASANRNDVPWCGSCGGRLRLPEARAWAAVPS